MRKLSLSSILVVSGSLDNAFSFTLFPGKEYTIRQNDSSIRLSSAPDEERKKEIFQEEAMNPANMKASAEMMQNMKPEDIDRMVEEMDRMPASQLEQMKSMGMNVDMMKSTMQMMKSSPEMMKSVGKMMENMSPEQLMNQSRAAQEAMTQQQQSAAAPVGQAPATPVSNVVDAVLENDDENDDDDSEPIVCEPEVLDAMFRVAEIMSEPQTSSGGVTLQAFATIPPISVLLNSNDDDSLTMEELEECWTIGSSGATRLDRTAFERVWMEVQDQYYTGIIEEAREKCHKKGKKKRGSPKLDTPAPPSPPMATDPLVGQSVDPELISSQLKNMSDDDVTNMFDQMTNISPAQEASMREMGIDPAMMKKSAEMFKNNPLMSKAATAMMRNTPPEQLMKASQQAQERLKNMSDEDKKKMLDNLK